MDKIAILIPCYNEEKTIKKVISDWRSQLPEAKIYVFDNNSTDKTVEEAKREDAIVKFEYKQGKGNVIRRMFREIDAECYIMVDGDDTYPADRAMEMASLVLDKNVDMVVGDRLSSSYYDENKRPFHNFGNNIVRKTINKLFKNDVKDIMTGCRAFSYRFVKSFPVLSEGFEIETEMTIHAVNRNMYVKNVVVPYKDRPKGSESKLNTYSDGLKVLKTIFKLFKNYRPFAFFGSLSLILLLVAAVLFIPILIEFLKTGLVPKMPTLFGSGFIALMAIQSFFAGMILENLKQKEKREFEIILNQIEDRYKEKK